MLAKTPPGALSPPLVAGLFYLAVALVMPSEFLFGAYAARRDGVRTKAGFSTASSPMANAATTQTGLSGVHRHEIVTQHF